MRDATMEPQISKPTRSNFTFTIAIPKSLYASDLQEIYCTSNLLIYNHFYKSSWVGNFNMWMRWVARGNSGLEFMWRATNSGSDEQDF